MNGNHLGRRAEHRLLAAMSLATWAGTVASNIDTSGTAGPGGLMVTSSNQWAFSALVVPTHSPGAPAVCDDPE